MKFNIKALLVAAALILGMQGTTNAMWIQLTEEGMRYSAIPAIFGSNQYDLNGKHYVSGFVKIRGTGRKIAAIARLNNDFTADQTFGENGLSILDRQGIGSSRITNLTFNPEGSITADILKEPENERSQLTVTSKGTLFEKG